MTVHAFPPGVRVLLQQDALFVVNVLRRFAMFRAGYDQTHLDAAAASIRSRLGEAAVDGLMSDTLLLDNELRLRTSGAFTVLPEGTPTASEDELLLLGMIASMQSGRYRQAAEAAVSLEIVQARTLLMLVNRLACRLSDLRIRLDKGVFAPSRPVPQARPVHPGSSRLRLVASA